MSRPAVLRTLILIPLLAWAAGCQPAVGNLTSANTGIFAAVPLQVYAAASLTEAFKAIGKAFEAKQGNPLVKYTFAGSQELVAQIATGAGADVFASADDLHMTKAVAATRTPASETRTFVRNRLIIVQSLLSKKSLKTPADLAQPNLKLVVGNADVPAGRYTLEFLDKATRDASYGPTFKTRVISNIAAYETNVRLVLDKVVKGEADAGIVYVSDVIGAAKGKVTTVAIPGSLNVVATYPIVALDQSPRRAMAREFVDYVLSDPAQKVLADHGFIPAAGEAETVTTR
ncbi:MAG: molybdate ABC transporter substrate-binding protein [Candidatus Sericytochromatia bacterium]|nr:molybdate ABC transporter substrate-binding protein [Candidatus Sericytochromatia bacterium]